MGPYAPNSITDLPPAPWNHRTYLDPDIAAGTEPARSWPGQRVARRRRPWLHQAGRRETRAPLAAVREDWRTRERGAGGQPCLRLYLGGTRPEGAVPSGGEPRERIKALLSGRGSKPTDARDAGAAEDCPGAGRSVAGGNQQGSSCPGRS